MNQGFPGDYMKLSKEKKTLYALILTTVWPIVLQNLLDSAVNMADVVMLDWVGQSEMSAVSLASNVSSIMFMFLFGLGSGVTMLGAQYWGKGDARTVEKTAGIAYKYTLIVGAVATALCLMIPEYMVSLYSPDPEMIRLGAEYLRVFSAAILVWGFSSVYLAALRSTGRVLICTVVETIALLMNVALNALFIFAFGMKIEGVALATVISRLAQIVICFFISSRSRTVHIRLSDIFRRTPALEKDFVRICMPAIGNDLVWGVAFSIYTAILGHLDTNAVAANALVGPIRNLGCVLCFGLASAAAIILGQMLGAGEREKAIPASRVMLRLAALAGAIGGLFILAAIPVVVPTANLNGEAREYLRVMMFINTVYIMGTAINTMMICGIFRAGGDSKFGFWCDVIDMWCYAVPLGLIAAFLLGLPVMWVYVLLCTDEFVKWPFVFRHYFSNVWAKNITRDHDENTSESVKSEGRD